jgi:hypothetical protein
MYSVALLFRGWCDLASEERKESQKQMLIIHFFEK